MYRRSFLLIPCCLIASPRAATPAPDAPLAAMIAALADRKPIVIMFSTPGCPFCHALRSEHLHQLERQQHSAGIHYREFDLSDRRPFGDAAGAVVPPFLAGIADGRDLARRLGVRIAPTVVFLGPEGEVAERLVGYGMRDFYAGYLDQRIAEARARLRS
jgi:thioredoxin-related protein